MPAIFWIVCLLCLVASRLASADCGSLFAGLLAGSRGIATTTYVWTEENENRATSRDAEIRFTDSGSPSLPKRVFIPHETTIHIATSADPRAALAKFLRANMKRTPPTM